MNTSIGEKNNNLITIYLIFEQTIITSRIIIIYKKLVSTVYYTSIKKLVKYSGLLVILYK